MKNTIVISIYVIGIIGWFLFWHLYIKKDILKKVKLLHIPFYLCLFFLTANLFVSGVNTTVGETQLEENLFLFLDSRSNLVISSIASILVVATIIYGTSNRKFPLKFIEFEAFSFISLLGLMAPVIWIPGGNTNHLMYLRHFQTIAFLWGVFLCISGIMILLYDLSDMHKTKHEHDNLRKEE